MAADHPLEVLERHHHNCHVVKTLTHKAVFEDSFDAKAAELVHTDVVLDLFALRWRLLTSGKRAFRLLSGLASHPNGRANVVVVQFVKDAV